MEFPSQTRVRVRIECYHLRSFISSVAYARSGEGENENMSEKTVVLKISKPHFTVKLYKSLLKIDLKGSVKNDLEEALENKPLLRESIGGILSMFVPLHIRLSHIDSVRKDKMGKVTIKLHLHRDIVIPLEPKEAKELVDKLNRLVPEEKKKDLVRANEERRLRKIEEEERGVERAILTSNPFPVPQPPGMLKKAKEAEKQIEEEKQD
jgi:hypothetical protein